MERRLMVGQEILVLFIMVRIRAPQPKIQPAFAGLIFGWGHGSPSATLLRVRNQVDLASIARPNRHGLRAVSAKPTERILCAPRTDRCEPIGRSTNTQMNN